MEDTAHACTFDQDPTRFDRFSFHQEGMLVDFSKHMITDETLTLLTDLAASCQLKEAMDALFSGSLSTVQKPCGTAYCLARSERSDGCGGW